MENTNIYALLIGVGDYEKNDIANLPSYRMDLAMMCSSLMSGLKIPRDNIRLMAGKDNCGYVTVLDVSKAIAGFASLLPDDSTFIFYFSGHGRYKNLTLSDGLLSIQSVIDYISKIPSKSKVVVIDCCYSGNFEVEKARKLEFEDTISEFAGRGIAVLASAAANEVARLGPRGKYSMFTGALSTAIAFSNRIRDGRLALRDIYIEAKELMDARNRLNPGDEQTTIFRSSMGGTVFFRVKEAISCEKPEITHETPNYKIVKIERFDSRDVKRLRVFVILKNDSDIKALSKFTKQIVKKIKYAYIDSMQQESMADAVWCYFAHDESDILNHLHFAYTIWAVEDIREMYYKPRKNTCELDEIYICKNTAYDMLKKMQKSGQTREEFIKENKSLLAEIVTLAEKFIADMQEVANKTLSAGELQLRYKDWMDDVRRKYIRLSDGENAPDDLHEWADEIMSLAGWIQDMAVLLENKHRGGNIGERELWLINNAIRHYNESLEKIKIFERGVNL